MIYHTISYSSLMVLYDVLYYYFITVKYVYIYLIPVYLFIYFVYIFYVFSCQGITHVNSSGTVSDILGNNYCKWYGYLS